MAITDGATWRGRCRKTRIERDEPRGINVANGGGEVKLTRAEPALGDAAWRNRMSVQPFRMVMVPRKWNVQTMGAVRCSKHPRQGYGRISETFGKRGNASPCSGYHERSPCAISSREAPKDRLNLSLIEWMESEPTALGDAAKELTEKASHGVAAVLMQSTLGESKQQPGRYARRKLREVSMNKNFSHWEMRKWLESPRNDEAEQE
ncbi:hypothetical protein R3P38DRAFT_2785131 [Favolaschia claudopus]|uniref:Uncharacterized protein n=1 Tax=Favolaschia claudopus TaxID=2862362 RepID=A0AAW0AV94_9AGAR